MPSLLFGVDGREAQLLGETQQFCEGLLEAPSRRLARHLWASPERAVPAGQAHAYTGLICSLLQRDPLPPLPSPAARRRRFPLRRSRLWQAGGGGGAGASPAFPAPRYGSDAGARGGCRVTFSGGGGGACPGALCSALSSPQQTSPRRDAEGRPEPHVPRGAPRQVRAAEPLSSSPPFPRAGRRRQRPFRHSGVG